MQGTESRFRAVTNARGVDTSNGRDLCHLHRRGPVPIDDQVVVDRPKRTDLLDRAHRVVAQQQVVEGPRLLGPRHTAREPNPHNAIAFMQGQRRPYDLTDDLVSGDTNPDRERDRQPPTTVNPG